MQKISSVGSKPLGSSSFNKNKTNPLGSPFPSMYRSLFSCTTLFPAMQSLPNSFPSSVSITFSADLQLLENVSRGSR